jgi:small neutral amino acid transporter SnatA (MarC family)
VWAEFALSTLVTLAVVIDPIGLAPAFASITQGMTEAMRRTVARRAAVIAALILFGTAIIGNWLLTRLGISLPAFRISGGILLFAVARKWRSACARSARPTRPRRPSRNTPATSPPSRWRCR